MTESLFKPILTFHVFTHLHTEWFTLMQKVQDLLCLILDANNYNRIVSTSLSHNKIMYSIHCSGYLGKHLRSQSLRVKWSYFSPKYSQYHVLCVIQNPLKRVFPVTKNPCSKSSHFNCPVCPNTAIWGATGAAEGQNNE